MSNNTPAGNSASHWCKAVIEQAVPGVKNVGASILNPLASSQPVYRGGSTSAAIGAWANLPATPVSSISPLVSMPSAGSASMSAINPAYMAYYQQYYARMYQATTGTSATATNMSATSTPASAMAPSVASYKAALTSDITTTNVSTAASSSNSVPRALASTASSDWNSYYRGNAASTSATTPYSVAPSASAVRVPTAPPTLNVPQIETKKPNPSRFAAPQEAKTENVGGSKGSQPASLRDFVMRSFATCTNDKERQYVSGELQKLISKVTAEGRLHVHKWELEPVIMFPVEISAPPSKKPLSVDTNVYDSQTINKAQESKESGKKRKSRFDAEAPASTKSSDSVLGSPNSQVKAKTSIMLTADKLLTPQELQMREKRAHRFQPLQETKPPSAQHVTKKRRHSIDGEVDVDSLKIVGTCQKLEKDYLRLTSAPLPSVVRPESVLKRALQLVMKKWDNDEADYVYMCSQLKSIRQDLTVQHIQNDFSVHVYETHARVALESDDLNEYNQCQTQLKQLYHMGLKGNEFEFIAYRILYYVYLMDNKKYTSGSTDMIYLLQSLTEEAKRDEAVQHALKVHKAMHNENYQRFFQLYPRTPNMGLCILDMMVDSMRIKALQRMNKGYKMSLDVMFVLDVMAFELGKDDRGKLGKLSDEDMLKIVIAHTPVSDGKEMKVEEKKEEEDNANKKKKKKKSKSEKVEKEIGHHILPKHHSDHNIEHIIQTNIFAGLQFLYKAGCKITAENGVLMWDTKNATVRSSMEVLGEEKLLL